MDLKLINIAGLFSIALSSVCLANTTENSARKSALPTLSAREYHAMQTTRPLSQLVDGVYVGGQAGYTSYRVHENQNYSNGTDTTRYTSNLSANGLEGGVVGGYGHYFNTVYVGGEAFGSVTNNTNTHTEINTNNSDNETTYTRFTPKNSYGIDFMPGYKVNDNTLTYLKLGFKHTNLLYKTAINNNLGQQYSNNSTGSNGLRFGVGLETALHRNWSLRGEFTHTNYTAFSTTARAFGIDTLRTRVSPSDNEFAVGVNYHINFG